MQTAQLLHVLLQDRILVHIRVHGRRDINRCLIESRHDDRRQQVIRDPACDLTDHIGCCRRDQYQVRVSRQVYMLDDRRVVFFEFADMDFVLFTNQKKPIKMSTM